MFQNDAWVFGKNLHRKLDQEKTLFHIYSVSKKIRHVYVATVEEP